MRDEVSQPAPVKVSTVALPTRAGTIEKDDSETIRTSCDQIASGRRVCPRGTAQISREIRNRDGGIEFNPTTVGCVWLLTANLRRQVMHRRQRVRRLLGRVHLDILHASDMSHHRHACVSPLPARVCVGVEHVPMRMGYSRGGVVRRDRERHESVWSDGKGRMSMHCGSQLQGRQQCMATRSKPARGGSNAWLLVQSRGWWHVVRGVHLIIHRKYFIGMHRYTQTKRSRVLRERLRTRRGSCGRDRMLVGRPSRLSEVGSVAALHGLQDMHVDCVGEATPLNRAVVHTDGDHSARRRLACG